MSQLTRFLSPREIRRRQAAVQAVRLVAPAPRFAPVPEHKPNYLYCLGAVAYYQNPISASISWFAHFDLAD